MRTIISSLTLIIALSTLSWNSFENSKAEHLKSSVQSHPVRDLYLTSIDAFNEGNLELFLANFAPNIKMYGTDGIYFGMPALRQRFQVLFERFPNMKMEIPHLEVEELSKKVVLVNFEWKLFPMGQGPAFSGKGSGIYRKIDGKWVEVLEAETVTHTDEALRGK